MNPSLEETLRRADALYDERARLENVRASVRLLQEAGCDDDYQVTWRLGRALFFLGQEATQSAEARRHHARAVSFCQRGARLRPERVEAHFWLGVNLALLARLASPLQALRFAWSARRSLKRATRLDAAYHGAGPLRVLARLQHKLPRLLGGGHSLASLNFERAIRLAPANTVTRLYFAEMLIEMGERERACSELEALLGAAPEPGWAFESARDRQLARQLLDELRAG